MYQHVNVREDGQKITVGADGLLTVPDQPKTGREITVKDLIADAFLQQILLRPASSR